MKSYYVKNCEQKQDYDKLIDFLMANSEAFSLVYFRYREGEKPSAQTKRISSELKEFKLYQKNSILMPSMITLNENKHIYKLTIYKTSPDALACLKSADSLWNWDYPERPMDLCFFRNGYAWFVSSAHEENNDLITDEKEMVEELRNSGFELVQGRDRETDMVFHYPDLSLNAKYLEKML